MDNGVGDLRNGDVPWASVFDAGANVRALTAIQAEGFRAASELVDNFVRIASNGRSGINNVNGNGRPDSATAPLPADPRADLYGALDIEPLIRSWWSMVGQFLVGSAPSSPPPDWTGPATLDLSSAAARGELSVEGELAATVTTEVWLHNTGATDLGEIRLRCSDLLSDDGGVLDADLMTFDPVAVPMPGRSNRGIELKIDISNDVALGIYRGTLLVQGHPSLWLPIALTVRAPVP